MEHRDSVLTARTLSFGYHRRAVLQRVSFDVRRGEILGIVGPNGCGKTTLLRTILGLLKPLHGQVERQAGLSISYVPQRDRIDTILPVTALEVVLMGRAARAGPLQRVRHADLDAGLRALARLGAEPLSQQLFRNLSGGQQQRVLLARALAADTDVLVLDEPTAGMDAASEAAILEFLRNLNRTQSVTILIVTHLLPIVLNLATSIMLLGTRTILHVTVDEVLREERLSERYRSPRTIWASSPDSARWSWAGGMPSMFEPVFMRLALIAAVATGATLGVLGVYLVIRRVVFLGLVLAKPQRWARRQPKSSTGPPRSRRSSRPSPLRWVWDWSSDRAGCPPSR